MDFSFGFFIWQVLMLIGFLFVAFLVYKIYRKVNK